MSYSTHNLIRSWWVPARPPQEASIAALSNALHSVAQPMALLDLGGGQLGISHEGSMLMTESEGALPLRAFAPALLPGHLGDPRFLSAHGVRLACVSGAMANGIASVDLVEAMARAGMMAFFGAAGVAVPVVEAAVEALQQRLGDIPFGFNLIHSPNEPGLEDQVVDLYLRRGVRRVCAAAFLSLTLPVVRYRFSGIHRGADGEVVVPNRVFAKVSRTEVARKFLSPPPQPMLAELVRRGVLSAEQADMAATLPVAEDITAEADSGGHTDNRPALVLLPAMLALRDEIQARYEYATVPRVGAAGGIATPASAAAAFAMGAAYVLTGSINQCCVESGSSDAVRDMLAHATPADVTMAPAADMFEMGVKVQVLKWGTMFPVRARKLYDLYRAYNSLDELPAAERAILERDYFRCTLEETWQQTRQYFAARDAHQIERAEQDPHHKMALVFRSFLGRTSKWANQGEPSRKVDYQIWCGPGMGAFNEWVKGSFLEELSERRVATVNLNLMMGAAVLTRANWLRQQGAILPAAVERYVPLRLDRIEQLMRRAAPKNGSHAS